MNQHFHNTIELEGENLIAQNDKCLYQEQAIMEWFELHPYSEFAPHEVWMGTGYDKKCPLTSFRRGVTNCTKAEKLVKTKNKVKGLYGLETYTWKLLIKEGQRTLF